MWPFFLYQSQALKPWQMLQFFSSVCSDFRSLTPPISNLQLAERKPSLFLYTLFLNCQQVPGPGNEGGQGVLNLASLNKKFPMQPLRILQRTFSYILLAFCANSNGFDQWPWTQNRASELPKGNLLCFTFYYFSISLGSSIYSSNSLLPYTLLLGIVNAVFDFLIKYLQEPGPGVLPCKYSQSASSFLVSLQRQFIGKSLLSLRGLGLDWKCLRFLKSEGGSYVPGPIGEVMQFPNLLIVPERKQKDQFWIFLQLQNVDFYWYYPGPTEFSWVPLCPLLQFRGSKLSLSFQQKQPLKPTPMGIEGVCALFLIRLLCILLAKGGLREN